MSVIYRDIQEIYEAVSGDQPVIVRVEIGNGQYDHAYSIFVGTNHVASNQSAVIGTGQSLQGKQTLVSVVVRDMLTETNWTSMRVVILEGVATRILGPYREEVPVHRDTVIYSVIITHQ